VVALLTDHREAVVTVNEMIVAASHDDHLRPTFHAYQEHLAGLLAPCVGGRKAGFMVAAALQGLILSAPTYQDGTTGDRDDTARWRAAVVDLISRLRSR
jgi:TetR/AcrR family transcriptional regulator, regulator of biofilm formation and stress response